MMDLQLLLEKSSREHAHLCPRQILGVRLGLAGMKALDFVNPPGKKRLLVIVETDGCFTDGVAAATDCSVGHRTLRVEDLGKTAAVFVDTHTGKMIRLAPVLDIRTKANHYAPDEPSRYDTQMQAYQFMPDVEMFSVTPVTLNTPLEAILSHPGIRVKCDVCGEEVMNGREVIRNKQTLCRTCAGESYYRIPLPVLAGAAC